jgi:hypothetical protein
VGRPTFTCRLFGPGLLGWLLLAGGLQAQVVPRTVSGVVHDSGGRPLANAVIGLDPSDKSRATRADAQGRFRFDNVPPGRHQLRTTWLGYRPDDRTLDVPADGIEVDMTLTPLPFQLDTLAIVARRTGMIGTTVAHTDFRALGGTDVQVLGQPRARARSGADGRFSFPSLRPGAYVVQATRKGFKTRLVPAVVPAEDAVELALALDSLLTKSDRLEENLYSDLKIRVDKRSAVNSALVSRHELASSRGQTLDVALRYAPSYLLKGLILTNDECVYVDGRPAMGLHARDFNADDVAMVEVYASGSGDSGLANQPATRALFGGTPCGIWAHMDSVDTGHGYFRYSARPNPGVVSFLYVWLKH